MGRGRAQGPQFAYPPGQAACGFLSVLGQTGHFLTSHPDWTPCQNITRAEWRPRYDGGQREARGMQGRTGRSITVAAKASSKEQGEDRMGGRVRGDDGQGPLWGNRDMCPAGMDTGDWPHESLHRGRPGAGLPGTQEVATRGQ